MPLAGPVACDIFAVSFFILLSVYVMVSQSFPYENLLCHSSALGRL